jgi:amino acid adenylation domain-containing protein
MMDSAEEIDGTPLTPAEELLAGVFAALLGRDRVGAGAHFFHLGGHSLLATRLVSRVRELFGVEIPLRAVFEAPTVAGLAAAIEALRRQGAGLDAPPIVRLQGESRRGLPLSFAQQRLWFLDRLQPGTAAYNIPLGLRLQGPLALPALSGALAAIVARHEVLRTAFAVGEGEPVQVVLEEALVLPLVDLAALPGAAREMEAARLAAVEADLPFDLERGPVLRATALRLDDEDGREDHRLLLTLHHIAADGWSVGVLLHELAALYGAALAGSPSPLPPLAVQYADFAVWQRSWLSGDVLAAQLAFWRRTLEGSRQVLELPADRPRPTVQSQRGASERFALPPDLAAGLARVARENGATLYMTLLAAFGGLVHRYTGAADFLLASPIANRNRAEIEGLIGFFVNTLVLRSDLGGDPTFAAALGRVRDTALAAYAHQDLPFEKLVEELAPERDLSRSPLVQVSLSLQNAVAGTTAEPAELAPGLALAFEDVAATTAKLDLSLGFEPVPDGLAGGAEYSTDLFDAATIRRLFGHLRVLFEGVVADPAARLSQLPLLTAEERRQLAAWHAETAFDHPRGELLHQPFEAQAARSPEALALIVGEEEISYGELDARAEALAHHLAALGVGPEVAVGLCLTRNADLIVAMLATLKAGGFYVPLDPNYPAERLGFMLADSRCRVILAHRSVLDRLPAEPESAVVVLDELETMPREALPRRVSRQLPGNLAYLIYTSGSTGRPKAVAIEHRSAALLADWARRVYTPAELAGVLGSTSITFDMSVFEIFATLALGGTLILAENALALPRLPARDRVTLIDTVPSAIAELLAQGAVPASVLTVNLGGEPVPRALADRVYERPGIARLLNLYGPSEDTTFSTVALIERGSTRAPAIGRPFDRTRAHVVDSHLGELPAGVPGELYLGGDGLARGYLGQPALTADRFGPDPFGGDRGEPGARLYRTGDLARRRPDGELEYLGRIDHQVKIRGFRVELGEIESALLAQPGVAAAAVMARESAVGDLRLVAYLVPTAARPEGETPVAEFRRALAALLPDYMVPAAFVWLPELPLSPNGKVDRRRLPAPDTARLTDAFEPPRTELERAVAGIWAAVLGVERIGRHDNFWHLGGHSLLATKVLARLHAELGIELPLQTIFNSPTLAELAAALSHAAWPADELVPVPREDGVPLPVSFGQERLWFLDRFSPGSAVYNLPTFYRLRGELDVPRLAAALAALVARHEVLRTVFRAVDGEPQQVVRTPAEARPGLPLVDLGALPAAPRDAEAALLARQESARPFDLERGPLLRAALLRLDGAEHLLLLDVHHIVSDGWSVGVMLRELAALYAAPSTPLPELPVQYADFAFWQRRWLAGEALAEKLAYWRRRLAGRPAQLDLPADRPRPAVQSFLGGVESLRLPDDLVPALERTGHEQRATLFMTLLAAFQVLLHRWSGQEDVVVGTPTANRNRPEIQELIGFFVNTLVLRTDLAGEPAFGELLARVRETALGAYGHQDLPFDRLVTELAPERDPARTPLFQVMFALHHGGEGIHSFVPGLGIEALEVGEASSKFDLSLHLTRAGSELHASAEYSAALFDADTVRRMLGHLAALLGGIAADPGARISELPLLSEAERAQLLAGWNETRAEFPRTVPVHRLFAARAAVAPEAPALLWEGGHLTYGELDARASSLARRLRALGVGAGTLVALLLERSPELVIAALAVLKAGGGYVPLDPKDPAERLSFVLDDTRAPVVVARAGDGEDAPAARLAREAAHAPRLLLLEGHEILVEAGGDAWDDETDAESTAYVIYTSGSTGRPKGVEVPHRAIGRLVIGTDYVHLGPGDRVAHLSNPAFDAAVFEVWGALLNGAAMVLVPREVALAPARLAALLRDREVTTMFLTTALFNLMVREAPGAFAALRDVLFGGEAVDPAVVRACLAAGPPARLLHVYGPTESTTFATWHRVTAVGEGDTVPIGRPLANTTVHVVDRRLRPVPIGVPGELAIGGDGLAHGYLHRPGLTAERFVPDPFASEGAGSRLYRTGDLVRRRTGGEIEFLGRLDTQVKVRGFRIELGEIEGALAAHPAVRAAVVLAREDVAGDRRLVAYVVAGEAAGRLDVAALRAFLERRLPAYMVPSAFVELPALPLNPNGKVDRRALPAPETTGSGEEYVAPRTDLEREVAAVWAEVLGVERIGLHDNFWHLGGHSLLATKVLSRLHAALGVDLAVATIFNAPTLAGFAAALGRAVLAEPGDDELDDLLAEIDGLVGARRLDD